jgi:hypothetical protein
VYLGEIGGRRGISYDSRRLDIEAGNTIGQSFIFRPEIAGTYILNFYKQDFIQDYVINDYVQVIVGERSGTSLMATPERAIAEPRWPLAAGSTQTAAERSRGEGAVGGAVSETPAYEERAAAGGQPEAPARESTAQTESAQSAQGVSTAQPAARPAEPAQPAVRQEAAPAEASALPSAPSGQAPASGSMPTGSVPTGSVIERRETPPVLSPAEYVRLAKLEFDAGRIEAALTILDTMKLHYPNGTDEAWWLYGQLLEANSSSRDIKLALEYYRSLVREFPQSNLVADAQRRIAFLERFYFNIR